MNSYVVIGFEISENFKDVLGELADDHVKCYGDDNLIFCSLKTDLEIHEINDELSEESHSFMIFDLDSENHEYYFEDVGLYEHLFADFSQNNEGANDDYDSNELIDNVLDKRRKEGKLTDKDKRKLDILVSKKNNNSDKNEK